MRPPSRLHAAWLGLRDLPASRALCLRVYPPGSDQGRRRRLQLLWSLLRHPAEHRAMIEFFAAPPWAAIAAAHPQLFQKIHKPFPCRGTSVAQRGEIVRAHYRLLRRCGGEAWLAGIAARQDWLFCRVELPGGQGALPVLLGKQPRFEREGELTLSLQDPFGALLYSACVTLREEAGQTTLLVGSLNGTAPREVLRHITKLSHGLRPQSLLVFLVQRLAAVAGAVRIDAVGRDTHAYWGNPRHAEIRFDYDAFWREEGATPGDDGLYRLPLVPRRRTPAEMPGHKRGLYLRRYAWLDEVAAAVQPPAGRAP